MAIFEIINVTYSLIQNIIGIVSASVEAYLWYFNLKTLETMLNYVHQLIKIRLVFHTPYLWKPVTPNFYFSSETIK